MKLLISLFILLLFSANLYGACGYSANMSVLNYTASDVNPSVAQKFTLYRHSGGPECDYFVLGFSRGASSTYNRVATSASGATINYNIYKNSSAVTELRRLIDATSSSQVITSTIERKETKDFEYFFKLGTINSATATRGGTYVDTIQVEASPGQFNVSSPPETTQPLLINIFVPTSISISLVDTGAAHDTSSSFKLLDFGELSENEELGFDIRIVSNAGYNLKVSSSNNQKLQLDVSPANVNNQINYDFFANNALKNLSTSSTTPVTIGSGVGATPAGGVAIPIKVVIKSVDNKNAGNYKDYVTFSVITTE